MGSIAEEVIRRAQCPVLVCKAPLPIQLLPAPDQSQCRIEAGMGQGRGVSPPEEAAMDRRTPKN